MTVAARASSVRSRQCRARQSAGRWSILVEVDIERVRDELRRAGLLGEWDFENRPALGRALSVAIALWLERERRERKRELV